MLPIEVEGYVDAAGVNPFEVWFDGLAPVAAARVTVALTRMGLGAVSSLKGVGGGVLEHRIDSGPGYRIYLGRDGDRLVILLGGGTKRRQARDIEAAKTRWVEYRARKKALSGRGET
jgi:putative addiction module killer protein